mmetsp:Transcript_2493/g.5461  ORF Transcript_2493/g.5461 Transcript_2493/m.5461 type:complete len:339 (+) Transcript_2493:122-1138(+)
MVRATKLSDILRQFPLPDEDGMQQDGALFAISQSRCPPTLQRSGAAAVAAADSVPITAATAADSARIGCSAEAVAAAGLPSVGSVNHVYDPRAEDAPLIHCKPCKFINSRQGCRVGFDCVRCHFNHRFTPRLRPPQGARKRIQKFITRMQRRIDESPFSIDESQLESAMPRLVQSYPTLERGVLDELLLYQRRRQGECVEEQLDEQQQHSLLEEDDEEDDEEEEEETQDEDETEQRLRVRAIMNGDRRALPQSLALPLPCFLRSSSSNSIHHATLDVIAPAALARRDGKPQIRNISVDDAVTLSKPHSLAEPVAPHERHGGGGGPANSELGTLLTVRL